MPPHFEFLGRLHTDVWIWTAPIDPPRRRSSLFFSKVLQNTPSPKTPGASSSDSNEKLEPETKSPRSNIGRRRLPSPITRSIVMPGHVAQMQKLFQTAKASLRLDVRFAACPVGSIDSRLPTSPEDGEQRDVDRLMQCRDQAAQTPPKDWRYSTAPRLVAEFDMDVREPFPEGSPQLPEMLSVEVDKNKVQVVEPPSSGFTSPVHKTEFILHVNDESVLPVPSASKDDISSLNELWSTTDLERPMTQLRVSNDHDMGIGSVGDSPIISHLKRKSADIGNTSRNSSSGSEDNITLSAPARAAADSAKLKRGILSDLFLKPPTHKGSDAEFSPPSPTSQQSRDSNMKACPDPLLHERGPVVLCPDPALHFRSCTPNMPSHRGAPLSPDIHSPYRPQHDQNSAPGHPPLMFSRATATGSPMPLLKVKSPPMLPGGGPHDARHHPTHVHHPRPPHHYHEHWNRDYPAVANEHFQPGWYYAKDSPHSAMRSGPAMYSFSTAAAKVVGQDPSPDSRIRDSYRTDTLTPLAKPPSRFKKNGIVALANARGVGKHYGGLSFESRAPGHRMHSTRSRLPNAMRFRSSPPSSMADSVQISHPRKRSREVETPTNDNLEYEPTKEESIDPKLRLEEGEDVIEIDEETRAAVRMSLYGGAPPISTGDGGRGIKELSPNVVPWRRGARPPRSRKKRRPSYWDGDLEEVVRSPAARRIVSSPIKKDDVQSLQAEVDFQEHPLGGEMQISDDELEGISRTAEGPTVLPDGIEIEG